MEKFRRAPCRCCDLAMLLSLLPAPLLVAAPSIIPNLVSAPSRKLQQCPYGSDDDAYAAGVADSLGASSITTCAGAAAAGMCTGPASAGFVVMMLFFLRHVMHKHGGWIWFQACWGPRQTSSCFLFDSVSKYRFQQVRRI